MNEIKLNVPEKEYRESEGVSQSDAKEMLISPAHYYARITEKKEPPTDAQIIGRITHRGILEGKFNEFCVRPRDFDGRTKEGKAWLATAKEFWGKQYPDLDFSSITTEAYRNILGMIASVKRHPIAKSILEAQGNNEVSCWKEDKETGLLLKGRADRMTTDANGYTVVADLKTVQRGEGDRESFSKSIFNWGYAFQAYWYSKLLFEATFFVFIVVEKEAPWAVSCYALDNEAMAYGGRRVREVLAKIKECQDKNEWPAYGSDMQTIGLPEWVMRRENL